MVLARGEWREVKVAQGALDVQGRIFCMEFKAAEKLPGLPLERLLVKGLYGYNDPHAVRARAENLISSCKSKIDKYTQRFPTGKVIVLGDFNAATDSLLDTDRGKTEGARGRKRMPGTLLQLRA